MQLASVVISLLLTFAMINKPPFWKPRIIFTLNQYSVPQERSNTVD